MILANKNIGETPLELIKRLKKDKSKLTYAGRLDPMAEGLMILLEGDEVHDKDKYLFLDKEYHLDILLGISTDTYDPLGLITNHRIGLDITTESIRRAIKDHPRDYLQSYPPYSSKPVNGKPLWWWAKNNKIDQVIIPDKKVKLKNIKLKKIHQQPLSVIVKEIVTNIKKVSGDFRQKEIAKKWNSLAKENPTQKLTIISLVISCSSGTYMRSIANQIGQTLGVPTLAKKIKRTKIGDYK